MVDHWKLLSVSIANSFFSVNSVTKKTNPKITYFSFLNDANLVGQDRMSQRRIILKLLLFLKTLQRWISEQVKKKKAYIRTIILKKIDFFFNSFTKKIVVHFKMQKIVFFPNIFTFCMLTILYSWVEGGCTVHWNTL